MVFNKDNRTHKRKFFFKKKVEFMRNFTYLGFNVSLVGNIRDGLFNLHKRAQKAFYQLKNQLGDMFYREPVLAIKLFNALVKPILLYCSDFWRCYCNNFSFSDSTDGLNISLCKHLSAVKRQTSNVASLLEMGRHHSTLMLPSNV